MTDDTCDYCFRPFGWSIFPICVNCGIMNKRRANLEGITASVERVRVEGAVVTAPEVAVMKPVLSRPRAKRKETR